MLALVSAKGAEIIVQDQATSVVWGMPGAVHGSGLADHVLPIESIGDAIVQRSGLSGRIRERI